VGSVLFEIRKKVGAAIFGSVSGLPACRILAVTQIRQLVDRFTYPELLKNILSLVCSYPFAAIANVFVCI